MKHAFSRLSTVILAMVLLCSLLPANALAAPNTPYGKAQLASLPNSDALCYVYDTIEAGVKDVQASVQLAHSQYKVNADELNTVFQLMFYDHPEFVWLNGGYSMTSTNGVITAVNPVYNTLAADLTTAKAKLTAAVQQLCNGLNGKSDYEKSLLLHNRLALAVSYASSTNDQNAYGALVEGKAVCAGYSRAYQLLLQEVDIPAWSVTGRSFNPVNRQLQSHEWNLVSIDGEWYYTDVTWDDQGDTEADIFYSYLNINTKQLEENHQVNDFFLPFIPKTTASAANYFRINGGIYSGWDQAALVKQLSENGLAARVYADMTNPKDFYAQVNQNIKGIVNDLGITGSYSYSCRELDHEFVFTFTGTVSGKTTTIPTTEAMTTTTVKPTTATAKTTIVEKTTGKQSTSATVAPLDKPTGNTEQTIDQANTTATQGTTVESTTADNSTESDPTSLVGNVTESSTAPSSVPTQTIASNGTTTEKPTVPVALWIGGGIILVGVIAVIILLLVKKR